MLNSFPAHFRSLKFVLLFATGCVASLLVVEMTMDGVEAWEKFKYAQALRAAEAAGNRLGNGIYFLLREQPSVNAAYKSDSAAASDLRQRIADHRKASDDNLDASLPRLFALDIPDKAAFAEQMQSARNWVNKARRRTDEMVAVPKAQRDQQSLTDYNSAMTALISVAEKLWAAEAHFAAQNDPVLTHYSRIKRLSWNLREIAGLERSVIASAIITGGRVSPEGLRQIETERAKIQFGWDLLQELSRYEETPVPTKAAVTEAERQYFGTFQPLVDRMVKLNEQNTAITIPLGDWIAQTNPHIDSFLEVLRATAKAGEDRTAELESDAFNDLIARIASVLAAVGATAACSFIVFSRVVRDLASGKLDVEVTDAHRRDEIGEMARAVDFFKSTLIETRRITSAQDAERAAKERRSATLEALAKTFEAKVAGVVQSLERSSTELETTSQSLSVSAEETNRQSSAVAVTARQTSANVQAVATATDELARSTQEIAEQVTDSARITGDAVDYARRATNTIKALAAKLPSRRICLPSMQQSRPRAPVRQAEVLRSSLRRLSNSPDRPQRRPSRSTRRSSKSKARPAIRSRSSAMSMRRSSI